MCPRTLSGGVAEVDVFPHQGDSALSRHGSPHATTTAVAASLRAVLPAAIRGRLSVRRPAVARIGRRALPQHPLRRLQRSQLIRSTAAESPSPAFARGYQSASTRSLRQLTWRCSCVPAARRARGSGSALRKGVRALDRHLLAGFAEVGGRGGLSCSINCWVSSALTGAPSRSGPNCLGVCGTGGRRLERDLRFTRRTGRQYRLLIPSSGALGLAMSSKPPEISAASACRLSSRSATRPTSPRTTCWSGWEGRPPDRGRVACTSSSFGNPRKFAELARRVARSKPILAVKSGTTDRRRAPPARTRPRSPARRRPSMRSSTMPESSAPTRSRSSSMSRRCSRRASAAWPRVAVLTNAGGLGIRRGRLRSGRPQAAPAQRGDRSATRGALSRRRQASKIPSTCSAPRPQRRTRRHCRWCSRILRRCSNRSSSRQ